MGLNFGYDYTLSALHRKVKENKYIPDKKEKVVIQYDEKGIEFSRFESILKAAKGLSLNSAQVQYACKKNRRKNLNELGSVNGFYLKFEDDLNNKFEHF